MAVDLAEEDMVVDLVEEDMEVDLAEEDMAAEKEVAAAEVMAVEVAAAIEQRRWVASYFILNTYMYIFSCLSYIFSHCPAYNKLRVIL